MRGISDLDQLVESYILSHDLKPSSVVYYQRCARVFKTWYGGSVPFDEFTVLTVNKFLVAKQQNTNLSCHYRKSLRNSMRALLNYAERPGKVRPVKWEQIEPQSWTPAEVARLIDACRFVRGEELREFMRSMVVFGYYTGLNQCDLQLVERLHIGKDGVLRFKRSKTGKLVVIALPPAAIDLLDTGAVKGPLWPRRSSDESFRKVFRRIAQKAGLRGSFKKLRKSSGTLVESLNPGAGHLHLGNTRAVFEKHYLNPEQGLTPMAPPVLPHGPSSHVPANVFALSERQKEICGMVANGKSDREIAEHFGLAVQTAINHRWQIAEKLGINVRTLKAWCVERIAWFTD